MFQTTNLNHSVSTGSQTWPTDQHPTGSTWFAAKALQLQGNAAAFLQRPQPISMGPSGVKILRGSTWIIKLQRATCRPTQGFGAALKLSH